jgi:carboxymethylenebutenolidase
MPSPTPLFVSALLALAARDPKEKEMDWTGVLDEERFAALHELKEGKAPAPVGEMIEIAGGRAYLSKARAPIGAVVVIHEWWGLNEHILHWTDRLAADGYVALAVDLYEGKVATTREEAMAQMRAVDEEKALAMLRAAHAFLVKDLKAERTACIGWCFGGGWSLRLAIAEPELDAAVIYYGRLVTDSEKLAAIAAPVLGIFGSKDEGIPPSAVAEFETAMKSAGKDLELHSYDAEHAFANPSSARYDAEHAADAWRETRAFLCANLWPPQPEGRFHDGSRKLAASAPADWKRDEPRPMRVVSFSLGDSTECYVSAFPGAAGGVKANVDRWRAQLGGGPIGEDEIGELPRVPVLGKLALLVRAEGEYTGMRGEKIADALLLGAVCELEGELLFVKMLGPKAAVEPRAEEFVLFCRALR